MPEQDMSTAAALVEVMRVVGGLDAKLNALTASSDRMVMELSVVQDHVFMGARDMAKEIKDLRVDVMRRLDEHSTKLTAIGEDISVNMYRADQALKSTETNRAEMLSLWRQVKRLESRMDVVEHKPTE